MSGFRWGPEWRKKDKIEYLVQEAIASIDTGTTCITGPENEVFNIVGHILASLEIFTEEILYDLIDNS